MVDHECDRFLGTQDGFMIFGCINPFDCHGELGLPHRYKIPLKTQAVNVTVTHDREKRQIHFMIECLADVGKHQKGEKLPIVGPDNLEDSKTLFAKLFQGEI